MTEPLSSEHPNLQKAVQRLQRTHLIWAFLLGSMGVLLVGTLRASFPTASLIWFVSAVLLAISRQPALLALVAIQWGISLASLIPGVAEITGPDPLSYLFEGGTLETWVLIGVRLVMVITAVNQFLFYRMLYGTESIRELYPDLAPIPEVIPNRTGQLALSARLLGFLGIMLTLLSIPLRNRGLDISFLNLAMGAGTLAMGVGLGVAFSPTHRRAIALTAVLLGGMAYMLATLIARIL